MTEAEIHRHIGRLEGEQVAIAREIQDIKKEQASQRAMIAEILEVVNKGYGGWRVIVGIGLVVTGIVALLVNLRRLWQGD